MDELFSSSNVPDTPTPINSAGTPTQKYRNAAGDFNLHKDLRRKVLSRKDLDQPKDGEEPMRDNTAPEYIEGPLNTGGNETDDATQRYFGSFSIEAKRNVFDLLKNHPEFDQKDNVRMNRVKNNTREVMPDDATKTVENGGYLIRQNVPQASQTNYPNGTKNY
ncbi:MAG: hypothetical protein ACO4AZ_10600 [Ilumatobacteraceae bacterium]